MKTSILRKSIFALVIVFAFGLFASATSPRNYLYDTKEVDGKIVSKVVFLQEEGLLNKEVKYEFSYNEAGKVSEKKAYRWNKSTENWDPYYLISYQYNRKAAKLIRYTECGIKRKKTLALISNSWLLRHLLTIQYSLNI
jgi:hypothetical protein